MLLIVPENTMGETATGSLPQSMPRHSPGLDTPR